MTLRSRANLPVSVAGRIEREPHGVSAPSATKFPEASAPATLTRP
jgi:hypothetical protein